MNTRTLILATLPVIAVLISPVLAQTAKPAGKPAAPVSCLAVLKAKVNLNKASLADLKCLPGVTNSIAKDIVVNRPLKNGHDFEVKIETIGRKLWAQIGQYSTF